MLEFNNNHIFTGYIKQLLASFNLPTYRVYTKENEKYFEEYGEEKNIVETIILTDPGPGERTQDIKYNNHVRYVPYIKNDMIQEYLVKYDPTTGEYSKGTWVAKGSMWDGKKIKITPHIHYYEYNRYVPNYTKRFIIKNNTYDSYTHEYLGDYLRFQRDYLGLDLMPLYNCFSNKLCTNCDIKVKKSYSTPDKEAKAVFDAKDTRYKIYMLPVKLFKNYTIAIDSMAPVELCCAVYGKYQDNREKFSTIPYLTYQKIGSMCFSEPIIYTKLATLKDALNEQNPLAAIETELAQNESDLKLFIKLPFNNTSTITVLEGDYSSWGDTIFRIKDNNITTLDINHSITNFEGGFEPQATARTGITEDQQFKLVTPLQLLKCNTGTSYPFADRLIEYLTGNAITNEDYISDNIIRLQKVLGLVSADGIPAYSSKFEGTWQNLYRPVLYNYINNKNNCYTWNTTINHDILGYVDKDVEKLYTRIDLDGQNYTIANIDIYPDIYKDDK